MQQDAGAGSEDRVNGSPRTGRNIKVFLPVNAPPKAPFSLPSFPPSGYSSPCSLFHLSIPPRGEVVNKDWESLFRIFKSGFDEISKS